MNIKVMSEKYKDLNIMKIYDNEITEDNFICCIVNDFTYDRKFYSIEEAKAEIDFELEALSHV